MYTINGKFLHRHMNGQIRVAIEMIKELDKIVPENFIEIVAPESNYTLDGLQRISIKRIGKGNGHIWEQTVFYWYLLKTGNTGINFLNSHPLLRPDISYIHDTYFCSNPDLSKSIYGRLQKLYTTEMLKTAAKKASAIITVSNFSKSEILKYFDVDPKKIHVIYNGWQHMESVSEDMCIFEKHKDIEKDNYILAASGITPQKNFQWIKNNAAYNTNVQYVIIGKTEKSTEDIVESSKNLIYVGSVSDGEMKALMHHCKAFIHPAIYEGFGLTPLEAVASGCKKIIISNAASLPEIYGNSAIYIDPYESHVTMPGLIETQGMDTVENLLKNYSWVKSAKQLYEILYNPN